MKLISLVENILTEESRLETLKNKYVGEGKEISDEVFNEILNISKNKFAYVAWFIFHIIKKNIHTEDLYKFEEYLDIFNKNKSQYVLKDINQYKTKEDIQTLIDVSIYIREKDVQHDDIKSEKDKYVQPKDIEKLKNVGIDYLGLSEGYQVFEVTNDAKNNRASHEVYRSILGRCSGRDTGAKIALCTMQSKDFFGYLKKYPGSSYFVLFNLSDPLSPYQIHYESSQFMDKNNKPQL